MIIKLFFLNLALIKQCASFVHFDIFPLVNFPYDFPWPEYSKAKKLIFFLFYSANISFFYNLFIPNSQHYSLNGVECLAAIIVGFFLFIITLSIISYYFSIISVGETLMFAIYKQKSDDYNILKRKDEEELEDKSTVDKKDETESDNSENIKNKT